MLQLQRYLLLPCNQTCHLSLFNKINGRNMLERLRAVEKESSSSVEEEDDKKFEVDPEKARQALQKLDQQLLSMSSRQVSHPVITVKPQDRPQPRVREEMPDFSGSLLAYSAFVLLLIGIFYNVIFITVIKPSIDFPEAVEATIEKPPRNEPMLQSPLSS